MATAVDVSQFQGRIDWAAVAGQVDIAVIRTGDGTLRDDLAAVNFAGARATKLQIHAYHYVRPSFTGPALVDYSRSISGPVDVLWFDLEDGSGVTTGWIAAALARCAQLGQRAGIYTRAGWWTPRFGAWWPAGVPLWVAGYPRGQWDPGLPASTWAAKAAETVGVDTPAGQRWAMWQFTDAARVPGINTGCDASIVADGITFGGKAGADMTQDEHDMLTQVWQIVRADNPRGLIPGPHPDIRDGKGEPITGPVTEGYRWSFNSEIERMTLATRGGPAARGDLAGGAPVVLATIPTAELLAELGRRAER